LQARATQDLNAMADTHSRIRTTTTVYRGRVFAVTVDQVTLPNGRTVQMEVVRHPGSVVLLAMPAPDRIVLIRQYRYAADQWLWELPAGSRGPGEAPETAASRECHEEIGRIPGQVERLGTLFPSPGFCDETMIFFRLTRLRGPLPTDPVAAQDADELLEPRDFAIADARQMVRDGTIIDMKTAFGLSLI
jgi:ADP-ribose pyrophosphatase